ncbi:MAG: serine hydrolase domain-containing protein [Verrucomicrobiota bacterium]
MINAAFESNFAERGEVGASLSVWRGEEEAVSLHSGFADRKQTRPWTDDTIAVVYSVTKGLSAACVLLALHEEGYALDEPVSNLWPQIKGSTFQQLLSHQAGLAALDDWAKVEDYEAVIASIEAQTRSPNWTVGAKHGYHARTFGFLLDEIVRRLTNAENLGVFWRERIADPMNLDFWMGLPPSEDHRVAQLQAGKGESAGGELSKFYKAFNDKDSLTRRVFSSPRGLHSVSQMNEAENWRLCLPAMGGIGSARSIAKFYAMMANGGTWNGQRILPEEVIDQAQQLLVDGNDQILLTNSAFSAGFMKDPLDGNGAKLRQLFGPSTQAFGHPGAGGSLAFADPENGIAFAYIMNQMELSLLPTEKALGLVRAVYEEFV